MAPALVAPAGVVQPGAPPTAHPEAPFKQEIERFHGALGSLGEIVAFIALGVTVDLGVVTRPDVWVPGVAIGAALLAVTRPVLVDLCLTPARRRRGERIFVLLAGLQGAVPILLAGYLLATHLPGAGRLYGIVVIVVAFSVVVQGGFVTTVARLVRLAVELVPPEPGPLACASVTALTGSTGCTLARRQLAGGRPAGRRAAGLAGGCLDHAARAGRRARPRAGLHPARGR